VNSLCVFSCIRLLAEGANMPTMPDADCVFQESKIIVCSGKQQMQVVLQQD
jgi:hypothetical protein